VEKAGLNHIPADENAEHLAEPCRRLRLAVHVIELDVDIPVSADICPSPLPSGVCRAHHEYSAC
jgi:hypothetical protein